MRELHRFWITFEFTVGAPILTSGIGCGVTAYDVDDALSQLRAIVFEGGPMPEVVSIKQDVDVSSLDERHVLPNMRSPLERGVWFPLT
jgi:hypothetical protein